MKDKYIKLKAMLLAGAVALSSSSLTGCNDKNNNSTNSETTTPKEEIVLEEVNTIFGPGEHIISVPISTENDVRLANHQYDYHPGYEPIGISLSSIGRAGNIFVGGAILYTNTVEVSCSTYLNEEGNYEYAEFGTPVFYESDYDKENSEYGIGEHIISVPLNIDNGIKNMQYNYHDGYEVVGIATTAYGSAMKHYGGGVILYKNTVPVKCFYGSLEFGTPIKIEKTMTLN